MSGSQRHLTDIEQQILLLSVEGRSLQEISEATGIAIETLEQMSADLSIKLQSGIKASDAPSP